MTAPLPLATTMRFGRDGAIELEADGPRPFDASGRAPYIRESPSQRPMDDTASFDLTSLLRAADQSGREVAWARLISRHTRLILSVSASFGGGHDDAMDRYTFILEKLRENDFRRLRAFHPDGTARFSTWLAFVARRLCVERHRARYGRSRPERDGAEATALRAVRRRLVDAVGDADIDLIADASARAADDLMHSAARDSILAAAVETLSPREQLLLKLRFDDDLPASRIATVLGLPTQFHVYRQLNAILLRLRNTLHAHGMDGVDG